MMVILVDTREQHPFTFDGYDVEKRFHCLGNNRGDYSIHGFQGRISIERKSMEDAQGTILGWGARRENFLKELEFLSTIEFGSVVVESSFEAMLAESPEWGEKTAEENRKIMFRQVLAWQQDFKVPWIFCDSRRLAETTTFRLLQRFFEKRVIPKRSPKLTAARRALKEIS